MSKKLCLAVVIGRFQPLHDGHVELIRAALERAGRALVLVASAHRPRCPRHPFTAEERGDLIRATFANAASELVIEPLPDRAYNDRAWAAAVQQRVERLAGRADFDDGAVAFLSGPGAAPIDYPRWFPGWSWVRIPARRDIRSAVLRRRFLMSGDTDLPVPAAVREFLAGFAAGAAFRELHDEQAFLEQYRAAWSVSPYPPVFLTADAVVTQAAQVLLVKRGGRPGKGLWALPGGFVDAHETLLEAVLRELCEETGLDLEAVPPSARHAFDAPHRSARGRTVSHGFFFELPPAPVLPDVRGGDDAERAIWLPLARLDAEQPHLFEDHYSIIRYFVG